MSVDLEFDSPPNDPAPPDNRRATSLETRRAGYGQIAQLVGDRLTRWPISNTTGDRRRVKGSIMLDKPFGRRTLLRGAGALTAASLAPWAAGCASDDENALTFFFAANPDEADARMRVVDEFQRRHPDIKVRPVLSGPGVMQQLSTFCAGGKCPDVLHGLGIDLCRTGRPGGAAGPQHDAGAGHGVRRAVEVGQHWAAVRHFRVQLRPNGGQYAFPEQWSGNYLFYNKQLFADAGVPPPPTTWDKTWTFAEFLDAATALTKRDGSGRATQWGFVNTCRLVLLGRVVRHEQRRARGPRRRRTRLT